MSRHAELLALHTSREAAMPPNGIIRMSHGKGQIALQTYSESRSLYLGCSALGRGPNRLERSFYI